MWGSGLGTYGLGNWDQVWGTGIRFGELGSGLGNWDQVWGTGIRFGELGSGLGVSDLSTPA
jgi:hypothetical protein